MRSPSIATAPGENILCCAFSVITVLPTTTSETLRGADCAAIAAMAAAARRTNCFTSSILIPNSQSRIRNPQSAIANPFRPSLYSVAVPLHIVAHPLVHDALVNLRDKRTPPDDFRRSATRISVMLASEALARVPTMDVVVESPLGPAPGRRVKPDVVV